LVAMTTRDVAGLDRPATGWATHDRRMTADVGYRVWNPFEAELLDAKVRRDEVAKGSSRAPVVFEP
jgi:hypothetical protein